MRAPLVLTLWLAVPALAWQAGDPPLETRLFTPVVSYSLSADGIADALAKAAAAHRIPIGIEWIKTADATARFSHTWHATTPLEILQDIMKAYPDYGLEIAEGLPIYAYPRALLTSSSDILNYRLDSFTVTQETVNQATARLACRLIPIMTGGHGGCAGSTLVGGGDRKMTFTLTNATVRSILNRALVESGRTAWIVAYPPDSEKIRAVGFLKMLSSNGSLLSWEFRM